MYIMWTNPRPQMLLLIVVGIVCLALYIYTYLRTALGPQGQQDVKTVTSRTSAEKRQHSSSKGHATRDETSVVKVQSAGNFTDRVSAFNAFLSSLRVEQLKRRGNGDWQRPPSSRLEVVRGARDDCLQLLGNYSNVTTVVLPWLTLIVNSSGGSSPATPRRWSSLHDHSNLLIRTYYEWTADDRLCSWIETPGRTEMEYDTVYNRKCSRNINDTVRPSSLQPLFLNGKPINRDHDYRPNGGNSYFYTDTPPYVFHMHIHRDAVVTELGDVITDGVKLVLDGCSNDVSPSLPLHLESIPLHNELFVVSQFWGTAVFHRMVEIVPRIALFLDFLRANAEIVILAPEVGGRLGELLEILGLGKSRLTTGAARAKIAYQPRSTRCGFPNVQESQMLSQLYRDYITRTFPPQPRDRLILIRRSGSRRFTERRGIEAVLKRAARDYQLRFTVFGDNPTPSLNDTMVTFHSAAVVVAPVGAAESNILFSQPGTYIIEGVCNPPRVVLCFQRLAYILGHHWHGMMSRGGCENVVSVSVHDMDVTARKFLHLWKTNH